MTMGINKPHRTKEPRAMTLFWHGTGPLMRYQAGILHIADLNPEMQTNWRMSRGEMFRLGWRCIVAAVLCRR